jgi:DNA-directed RNA polymerase sigma subunit (sigma70/sigma32)
MKRFLAIAITLVFALSMTSCFKKKEMAPEDFIKIQTEFLSTDMSDDAKAKISQKYGFTADQYNSFEERVESDIQLKTKVGEIRLKSQK